MTPEPSVAPVATPGAPDAPSPPGAPDAPSPPGAPDAPPPPGAPDAPPPREPSPRPLGLRLIILEKLVKAVFVLGTSAVFAVMLVTGSSVHLHGMATDLREHVTAAWSVYVADAVLSVTERRHLMVATAALFLDGVTTGLEWFALSRGHAGREWLVVAAMSALIPFEVAAFFHHQHAGRFVVLVGNIAIVAYLTHHAWKRARERKPASS